MKVEATGSTDITNTVIPFRYVRLPTKPLKVNPSLTVGVFPAYVNVAMLYLTTNPMMNNVEVKL